MRDETFSVITLATIGVSRMRFVLNASSLHCITYLYHIPLLLSSRPLLFTAFVLTGYKPESSLKFKTIVFIKLSLTRLVIFKLLLSCVADEGLELLSPLGT